MRFEERIDVPVRAAVAWNFLWQTQRLAACLPGCIAVDELEHARKYRATFEDHVGPYRVRFDIDVTVKESTPSSFLRLHAFGEDRRLGASQNMDLSVWVEPIDDGRTTLKVVADVQILGKIATLGQFVIKRKVKQVVSDFAKNVDRELRAEISAGPANA